MQYLICIFLIYILLKMLMLLDLKADSNDKNILRVVELRILICNFRAAFNDIREFVDLTSSNTLSI